MKGHTFGTGLWIAVVAYLLLLSSSGAAQQLKPGGTLRVAWA